jgi:peptidyl-tRNA hydrolase
VKLHVLVRSDLTPAQQAVQAGHAVAEFMFCRGETTTWRNGTLVYLSVPNEKELKEWIELFHKNNLPWIDFIEEDLGHSITAVAVTGADRLVKGLPLLLR